MPIALNPKVLAAVHSALKSIPDRRNIIHVAGMFHLAPADGGLVITATDCDLEAAITVECAASFEPICLPPYLMEAASGLSVADVKIILDDRQAIVAGGKARFAAPILPGGDFPKFRQSFDNCFEIAGAALAKLIQATSDAAATDDSTRYYLEGVCLQSLDKRLHAVATNGHRLHTASAETAAGNVLGEGGIIIATKAANEIARLAAKAGSNLVTVETNNHAVTVRAGAEQITSKLIEATYPEWRRVVPAPVDITATFDLAEMVAALDRVMKIQTVNETAAKSKTKAGAIRIFKDGDYLAISAAGKDDGDSQATDAVRAEFNGKWGECGVSARYLRATLFAMKERGGDTVTIDSADAGSPMRVESPIDEDFLAVVMRMRV